MARSLKPELKTIEPYDVSFAEKFKNVLDCGLTMGIASNALNAKMLNEKLPPIQYRISAEYGEVSVARSAFSKSEDLFGSAMNICAKINSKAKTKRIGYWRGPL